MQNLGELQWQNLISNPPHGEAICNANVQTQYKLNDLKLSR